MSHAANLRAHQHSAVASAKRRKLSADSTRPQTNGTNGFLNPKQLQSISAKPKQNAKLTSQLPISEEGARIGHAASDEEMTDDANGAGASSASDDDSDDSAEESPALSSGKVDRLPPDLDSDEDQQDDMEATAESHGVNGTSTNSRPAEQAAAAAQEGSSDQEDGTTATAEPSFGDLLHARASEAIEVPANNQDAQLVRRPNALAPPSAASLGTVLSQALRSNDLPLLESCLQVTNLQSIRATVERLPSVHAATLLQKLAERMHKRPGRAGTLMVWVQWTVVAHGGYLATQPAAMNHVKELHRVVKMRATALQPLLALKGKLDMLEAQVTLRRRRTAALASAGNREEAVIYVEGAESSDEDEAPVGAALRPEMKASAPVSDDSSDEEEALAMPNGASAPVSDVDDEEDLGIDDELESEDGDDLIDNEAEETGDDSDQGFSDDDMDFDRPRVDDDDGGSDDGGDDDGDDDDHILRSVKRVKSKH